MSAWSSLLHPSRPSLGVVRFLPLTRLSNATLRSGEVEDPRGKAVLRVGCSCIEVV